MPLPRDQFDEAGPRTESVILAFLKENFDLVYSAEEILDELGAMGLILTLAEVMEGLDILVQRCRVESKPIQGTLYYGYSRFIGFRPTMR